MPDRRVRGSDRASVRTLSVRFGRNRQGRERLRHLSDLRLPARRERDRRRVPAATPLQPPQLPLRDRSSDGRQRLRRVRHLRSRSGRGRLPVRSAASRGRLPWRWRPERELPADTRRIVLLGRGLVPDLGGRRYDVHRRFGLPERSRLRISRDGRLRHRRDVLPRARGDLQRVQPRLRLRRVGDQRHLQRLALRVRHQAPAPHRRVRRRRVGVGRPQGDPAHYDTIESLARLERFVALPLTKDE